MQSSSSSGTPTGSVQFVVDNISITIGLVNGVATTPSISGLSVGQYAVVASYVPTGSFSPSSATLIQTIINPPTTASMLILSGLPSALTAGTAGSVTVTAEDANGNVVTGYTGTILFTSTDPSATLPSPYTFTSDDAGSHTFPNGVIFETAGSQTLTAIDTTSGIRGTAAVTVSPTSAIADGTVLLLSSPVSGQSAPSGIIGIDPTTGAQAPVATGGSFVLPQVVREAADHQLYVVDYSRRRRGKSLGSCLRPWPGRFGWAAAAASVSAGGVGAAVVPLPSASPAANSGSSQGWLGSKRALWSTPRLHVCRSPH
jgi:hypothetical protein